MFKVYSKSFFLILFLFPLIAFSKDYVILKHSGVNIRTAPSKSSDIIGQASKGQIYEYLGEEGNYYKISLYSGVPRYIAKSLSAKINEKTIIPQHHFQLPKEEIKQKDIFWRIKKADKEIEQYVNQNKNKLTAEKLDYQKSLRRDRLIAKIVLNHPIHPALYQKLIKKGDRKKW